MLTSSKCVRNNLYLLQSTSPPSDILRQQVVAQNDIQIYKLLIKSVGKMTLILLDMHLLWDSLP